MKTLIFDTETTGIPKHPSVPLTRQPKVIEFGAVIVDLDGNEIDSENILIDPGEPLEAIITKVTGITDEDLKGQLVFEQAWPRIKAMIESADLAIAHNAEFDKAMINFEATRLGSEVAWPPAMLCTVQENVPHYGYRPKLIKLYEDVVGRPLEQTHRALDDVRALLEIVKAKNYVKNYAAALAGAE